MRSALLAALILPAPALALQIPQQATPGGDPHVKVATYDPDNETYLVGIARRPLTIEFCHDQIVQQLDPEVIPPTDQEQNPPGVWDTVSPDKLKDQPMRNIVTVWPSKPGRSSMQIEVGDGNGNSSVYVFRLLALEPQSDDCGLDRPDCDDPKVTTKLRFACPKDDKARQAQAGRAREQVQARQILVRREAERDRLKVDYHYGPHNVEYVAHGDDAAVRALYPNELWDNTQVTAWRWYGNRHAPTLAVVTDPPGKWCDAHSMAELPVAPNVATDGTVVVDQTAAHWRLRRDNMAVDVCATHPHPIGTMPGTGTSTPDVVRVVHRVSAPDSP